jgi:hypothetical protein
MKQYRLEALFWVPPVTFLYVILPLLLFGLVADKICGDTGHRFIHQEILT